jgi:predicted ATPase
MTPPDFTIVIQNLRALHRVRWSPQGTCALVGANGAGKSTLLLVLKALRYALDGGLGPAIEVVLGGTTGLRCWEALQDELIEVRVDLEDLSWRIRLVARLTPAGAVTGYFGVDEVLTRGDTDILSKNMSGMTHRGQQLVAGPDGRLGLSIILDAQRNDADVGRMARFIRGITVFMDPDLWYLREQGSRTTESQVLLGRSTNAFAVLRRWSQERPHRHRHQFVVEGLKAAFPGVTDLDFQEAGQTVVARVFRARKAREEPEPSPMSSEASGLIAMLVLLCDVASAEDGGVVAIDDPETALHPYAIRAFMRRTSAWARQHGLTVLLATHSTVLLDELTATPSQVFVMTPGQDEAPVALDKLKDPAWLAGFRIGELYADGEIGSNEDAAAVGG